METLKEQLIRHEGLRLFPYHCTAGKLTIGVGRNLEDNGITREEAMLMLDHDVELCHAQCSEFIPAFPSLNEARKNVLMNMCFNLGINGLLKFKNTLAAIAAGDFEAAAKFMLQSKWAEQVKVRAKELARQMLTGEIQEV